MRLRLPLAKGRGYTLEGGEMASQYRGRMVQLSHARTFDCIVPYSLEELQARHAFEGGVIERRGYVPGYLTSDFVWRPDPIHARGKGTKAKVLILKYLR